MPRLSMASPLGQITLTEEDGKITGLCWGARKTTEETPLLCKARQQLEAYFQGRRRDFDLPLAPQGTPFQKTVWQAMARIPHGATQSYGAMAKQLKSGPRAIGGACARNPIPILIPCHRILGAHGALGGYSAKGGVKTKRRLLSHEGAAP